MDASEKNPRHAGNVRVNAAHERRKLKHATFGTAPAPSDPLPVPVVPLPPDDPRMLDAERAARHRFDEFVEAFELRQATDTFAVKAAFRDDFGLEYLWFRVHRLDDDHLHGTLDNPPRALKSVRCGQVVKVARNLVHDWLVVQNGQTLGGFTLARGEAA